jgi:hypothetical protein
MSSITIDPATAIVHLFGLGVYFGSTGVSMYVRDSGGLLVAGRLTEARLARFIEFH